MKLNNDLLLTSHHILCFVIFRMVIVFCASGFRGFPGNQGPLPLPPTLPRERGPQGRQGIYGPHGVKGQIGPQGFPGDSGALFSSCMSCEAFLCEMYSSAKYTCLLTLQVS